MKVDGTLVVIWLGIVPMSFSPTQTNLEVHKDPLEEMESFHICALPRSVGGPLWVFGGCSFRAPNAGDSASRRFIQQLVERISAPREFAQPDPARQRVSLACFRGISGSVPRVPVVVPSKLAMFRCFRPRNW